MNISTIVEIVTWLLVVILGVLYTFFPRWSCRIYPPERRARMRKLVRFLFGSAFIMLGLFMLYAHFMKQRIERCKTTGKTDLLNAAIQLFDGQNTLAVGNTNRWHREFPSRTFVERRH